MKQPLVQLKPRSQCINTNGTDWNFYKKWIASIAKKLLHVGYLLFESRRVTLDKESIIGVFHTMKPCKNAPGSPSALSNKLYALTIY